MTLWSILEGLLLVGLCLVLIAVQIGLVCLGWVIAKAIRGGTKGE